MLPSLRVLVVLGAILGPLGAATDGSSPDDSRPFTFSPVGFVNSASSVDGPSFYTLAVGRSSRADVEAAFGPPVAVEGNAHIWRGTAQCDLFDLEALWVSYRADGILDQVRLSLRAPELLGDVLSRLRLGEPTETREDQGRQIRSYAPARVALSVRGDRVDTIWLYTPGGAGSPKAPPASQEAPAKRRLVLIQRVWCEHNLMWQEHPAMGVLALVHASGLLDREMRIEVRLRTRAGVRVRAVPTAPPGYADAGGFCMVAPDTVRHDPAWWNPYRIYIPYAALDLPPGFSEPLVVSLLASCGGLSSLSEAETLLPGAAFLPGAPRAVRILEVSHEPRTTIVDAPVPLSDTAAAVGGIRTVPVMGRDAWRATGQVEASGLRGQTMVAGVRLRTVEGRPVAAARGAPPSFVDAGGRFSARAADAVAYDEAKWISLFVHVPYVMVDLEAGRDHRLILTYFATCGGLSAFEEEEIVFSPPRSVPGPAPPPVPEPPPVSEPAPVP